jgi:hypothetical protein
MSFATWLFLYLAGLLELVFRYRVSFDRGVAAFALFLPLIALAIPRTYQRNPKLGRGLQIAGAVLALGCSIVFARSLSLEFWDTQRVDLAWLSAGIGVGGLFAIQNENKVSGKWQIANWLMVSVGWLLALWNPAGAWLAIAPAASLALWQRATPNEVSIDKAIGNKAVGLSAGWALFWIGMGMSKSWWDSDTYGLLGTALWAFGVAIAYVPKLNDIKLPLPLLWLALFSLLYAWLPIWLWAPLLGLLSGWTLQRTAKSWHWASAYALLLGLLLSYGLHSNLQWFGWLLWGSR